MLQAQGTLNWLCFHDRKGDQYHKVLEKTFGTRNKGNKSAVSKGSEQDINDFLNFMTALNCGRV